MIEDDFQKIDAELMARCAEVLKQRGTAYATQADRFSNFKEIAQQVGCSPLHVCHIYLLKGMSVINKLMRGETVPGEHEHERFADAINYLRLGYALRQELRREGQAAAFTRLSDSIEEKLEAQARAGLQPGRSWESDRGQRDLPERR